MKKLVCFAVIALAGAVVSAQVAESAPVVEISGKTEQRFQNTDEFAVTILKPKVCDFNKSPLCEFRTSYGKVQITWLPKESNFQIGLKRIFQIENHPQTQNLEQLVSGVVLSTGRWAKKNFEFPAAEYFIHINAKIASGN